jgi:hypothetical protein
LLADFVLVTVLVFVHVLVLVTVTTLGAPVEVGDPPSAVVVAVTLVEEHWSFLWASYQAQAPAHSVLNSSGSRTFN